MGKRGISQGMIDLTLEYGRPHYDGKVILGRKETQAVISELEQLKKVLIKILDKGGVTVVDVNDSVITTYNCEA